MRAIDFAILGALLGCLGCGPSRARNNVDPQTLEEAKALLAGRTEEVGRLSDELEQQRSELGRLRERGSAPPPSRERPPSAADSPPGAVLRPGDIVEVSVWKNKELSRIVSVRPDGRITLPLLNEVEAGGLTPLALREVLVQKLGEYIPNPEVSVIVREARSFAVSVIGEVRRAGRYELETRTTVLDALAMAGGLTEFASRRSITLIRSDGGEPSRIPFDYDRATSPGGEAQNLPLRPGDIIVVP